MRSSGFCGPQHGNSDAISRLAGPLERTGRFEEAAELWRVLADQGDLAAMQRRLSTSFEISNDVDIS